MEYAFSAITVTDVNDIQPVYGQESYYSLQNEDASVNDPVVTATCTDNDDGTTLSYRCVVWFVI